MVSSAAIYARISSDPTGAALGVTRQLEDCRRLAIARGWTAGAEYVDNDVSAFTGRRRPEYERMLADLRAGLRDAVVVYNLDRLTRRPIELETFRDVCEHAGVRDVATVTADIDMGTDDGLLMARVIAAFAAKESAAKVRRMKRAYQQHAEQGRPKVGGYRPYAYERDGLTLRPDEAEVVRQMVTRYLAGESLRGLATWLQDDLRATTTAGKPWNSHNVRSTLVNPRYAGLATYRGEIVAAAQWPGLITPDEHHLVMARIRASARKPTRTPRRYLLSGLVFCGNCSNRLYSARRENVVRRYVCQKGPDHGGCGSLTVVAEPLEAWVSEMVLARLASPDFAAAVAARTAPDTAALTASVEADTAQLDELAAAYATRQVTMPEWRTPRELIQARLDANVSTLAAARTAAYGIDPTAAGTLRETWPTLGLARQRAVIDALLAAVAVHKGPHVARFDPSRVAVAWRR